MNEQEGKGGEGRERIDIGGVEGGEEVRCGQMTINSQKSWSSFKRQNSNDYASPLANTWHNCLHVSEFNSEV